jgi:hypothetical protein
MQRSIRHQMKFSTKAALFAAAISVGSSLVAPAARAAIIATIEQQGANVVATASGTVDTAGLGSGGTNSNSGASVNSAAALFAVGSASTYDVFTGITGPTHFGSVHFLQASSQTGDLIAVVGVNGWLNLPDNYVSGASLSGTGTWDNTTLAALGLTTGILTWTWGSGATADSFTLNIVDGTSVPEPSTLSVLGTVLGAVFLVGATKANRRA